MLMKTRAQRRRVLRRKEGKKGWEGGLTKREEKTIDPYGRDKGRGTGELRANPAWKSSPRK